MQTTGESSDHPDALLVARAISKHFLVRGLSFSARPTVVRAVEKASFSIKRGQTLGLVGESGCGKSTLGLTVLRLLEPTSGSLLFDGRNLLGLSSKEMRLLRSQMQMIFQDPFESLDPRKRAGDIIGEPLSVHDIAGGKAREAKVRDLMEIVGLGRSLYNRYPHEFSGGQRQRIGIARALSLNPKLVVCDEVVSALDVSIQAQIINLLQDLQEQWGMSYLFISHDLGVVKHISSQVAVMYLGKLMELAEKETIFDTPLHPYTRALLTSIPVPNPRTRRKRAVLGGDIPSPVNPPPGCLFHTRCPYKEEICEADEPAFVNVAGSGESEHFVACHLVSAPLDRGLKRKSRGPSEMKPERCANGLHKSLIET